MLQFERPPPGINNSYSKTYFTLKGVRVRKWNRSLEKKVTYYLELMLDFLHQMRRGIRKKKRVKFKVRVDCKENHLFNVFSF